MINNPLDDIIKLNININNPIYDATDENFKNILVLVAEPTSSSASAPTTMFSIESEGELVDMGFSTTEEAYIAAKVAFSQKPRPNKLFIQIVPTEDTTVADVLTATLGGDFYYGIAVARSMTNDEVKAVADFAEANEKLFIYTYTDISSNPISVKTYARTIAVFGGLADGYESGNQPSANKYVGLAVMAKCFGYEAGTESWNMKELNGVTPSVLTSAQKKSLEENNVMTFLHYANRNVTIGGKVLADEWVDIVRLRDWLKIKIQTVVFNTMLANKKIPYTDRGIGLIGGCIESVLLQAQADGKIMENVTDADGNTTLGYEVILPKASQIPDIKKKSRKLTDIVWNARITGAIHLVEIEGNLTY